MVQIISDNSEVEQQLGHLCDLARARGALLNEDLTIACKGGNLSLEAPEVVPQSALLLALSPGAALPFNQFQLALQGDDISIASTSKDMPPEQVALLETMVSIYNLTHKVAAHRASSVDMLFFQDEALLRRITSDDFVQMCARRGADDFVLKSFLIAREFDFRADRTESGRNLVINPIADFLNNHPMANGFAQLDGKVAVGKFAASDTGNECFVKYGPHDDHLMLTGYGYVETRTPFVVSQELELDVPGLGILQIHRRPDMPHNFNPVPPQLEGLERFLSPVRISKEGKRLEIGCLHIPPKNSPRALRRILRFFFSKMSGQPKGRQLSQLVKDVEQQIVDANRAYYTDLLRDLAGYTAKPGTGLIVENIKAMAKSQLGKIDAYEPA